MTFYKLFKPSLLSWGVQAIKYGWMQSTRKSDRQAVKKTDGPRNKIVNEDWWQRLVREMYLRTSHSLPNPPSFTSAQSPSITDQLYPPVCATLVSFPSTALLLSLVPLENDKTGTTAELSVPCSAGRKLPSFHSFWSISCSCSRGSIFI